MSKLIDQIGSLKYPDSPKENHGLGHWGGGDKRNSGDTYISVMVSGRSVGISVRPSTAVYDVVTGTAAAGQCKTLQEGAINDW